MNRLLKIPFIALILGICMISCNNANTAEESTSEPVQDTTLYATQSFSLPKLSAKAEAFVADWPIFQEFEQEITALQKVRLERLTQGAEKLLVQADSLTRTLPDTLNSQSINSRLKVIDTRLKLLIQASKKNNATPPEIETQITETQKAIRHLWFQINEKVEKDQIDEQQKEEEEMELEKQRKARDSIFNLELQDQ